jgi:5-methylcytosine-specific restriction endonuclease McrA
MDFYDVAEHRQLIFERDDGRCFYCRRKVSDAGSLDHVDRRPAGNHSYRNVVVSCRRCNNRKGESSAEDLLRVLYREGAVRADLLGDRLAALTELREGRLKPVR